MKTMLAAAVVACSVIATPAAAAVVIDFENVAVGTKFSGLFPVGQPYFDLLQVAGEVVLDPAGGSNKVLKISRANAGGWPLQELNFWFTRINHNLKMTPTVTSMDAFTTDPEGRYRNLGVYTELPTSEWYTLALNDVVVGGPSMHRFYSTDAYVDNITYELGYLAVPEPTTWAMMITGFSLVGATIRRRRIAAVA